MMEVDPSSSPPVEQNIIDEDIDGDGQNSNSTAPGSNEQVTTCGTPVEDLWLEFKCVFCNQDLKNIVEPKLLQCLHTACASCLSTESNNSPSGTTSSTSGAKFLTCPACSQEINVNDAVDHLFLTEYVQNNESLQPEESSYPCTSCEEGAEGTGFCEECQEWLCITCVSAHQRVRVTKDHTVRSKEDMDGENTAGRNQKYLFCQTHSHEQLKLYCESCDKLTCRDCQLSNHKEHKYQFLTTACEEEKGNINELLRKIIEKQRSVENSSDDINKRNEEILERERSLTQEIKTFAVRFITDINKRGKLLLQDLEKVCSEKKNLLSLKNQELRRISERLEHCKKFAEAAVTLGSDTALVYSKKPIENQLKKILKFRCDVPNNHHVVNIAFNYEANFLTQYISTLGQILVDQHPIPGATKPNDMLPMPTSQLRSPIPTNPQPMQIQQHPPQQQQQLQQRIPQQQMHHRMPMTAQYGQPQVTSSTDMSRNNHNAVATQQMRQQLNNKQMTYSRQLPQQPQQQQVLQQRNNVQQSPQARQANYNMQNNAAFQQQQQQQQQQVQQNSTPALPMALRQNNSISVTTLPSPGPSPNKQRAIAPRNLNVALPANTSLHPLNNNSSSSSPRSTGPQLIVLDDNQKTPTMSNTNRLTHFPNIAATITAHPSLQIQPTNNKYSSKF